MKEMYSLTSGCSSLFHEGMNIQLSIDILNADHFDEHRKINPCDNSIGQISRRQSTCCIKRTAPEEIIEKKQAIRTIQLGNRILILYQYIVQTLSRHKCHCSQILLRTADHLTGLLQLLCETPMSTYDDPKNTVFSFAPQTDVLSSVTSSALKVAVHIHQRRMTNPVWH